MSKKQENYENNIVNEVTYAFNEENKKYKPQVYKKERKVTFKVTAYTDQDENTRNNENLYPRITREVEDDSKIQQKTESRMEHTKMDKEKVWEERNSQAHKRESKTNFRVRMCRQGGRHRR